MPIKKFRDIADVPPPAFSDDPDRIADRISFVWQMARATAPLDWPHGVRKYRSIEEANLDREAYATARARATRTSSDRPRPA